MKKLMKAMKRFLPFRSLAHETILLVDDDDLIRQFIVEYLLENNPGLNIDTARDGVEALDKITQQPPSILITNITMPEINGITLLKILQELSIYLPTLVISGGWTSRAFAQELAEQGISPSKNMILFLRKPFSFEQMMEVLEKLTRT